MMQNGRSKEGVPLLRELNIRNNLLKNDKKVLTIKKQCAMLFPEGGENNFPKKGGTML
ncbi:MAG: hypothetical protein MJ077_09215 [Oscillospiraceae bacterium]|nr:hypothetical protein [Oscillospiraceae bacterium]